MANIIFFLDSLTRMCDLSTEEKSQKDQVVTASKPSKQLLT